MSDLKVGDLVELKSGVTCVTTIEKIEDGNATCQWERKGRFYKEIFDLNVLIKHDFDGFLPFTLDTH